MSDLQSRSVAFGIYQRLFVEVVCEHLNHLTSVCVLDMDASPLLGTPATPSPCFECRGNCPETQSQTPTEAARAKAFV